MLLKSQFSEITIARFVYHYILSFRFATKAKVMFSIEKWSRLALEFASFNFPLELLGISFDDLLLVRILRAAKDLIIKCFF